MKVLVLISLLLISLNICSQTCATEKGVNLSIQGPYSGMHPRDQGKIGTCYAHSGTDLLSSYLKLSRINIIESAVASDNEANGGQPDDVINILLERGWVCKDSGQFWNLFPSSDTNIITELQKAMAVDMPVFYSMEVYSEKGQARQKAIAELAGEFASGEAKPCGPYKMEREGLNEFHRINKEISKIKNQIKDLDKSKSFFSSNAEINAAIAQLNKSIQARKEQASKAHKKYTTNSSILKSGKNQLDNYTVEDAAEIVYYWAEVVYPQVKSIFNKYGVAKYTPSMKQFIIERVHYDPILKYSYAGLMYPYKVIKRYMEEACSGNNRMSLPKNIEARRMKTAQSGRDAVKTKIESLLQAKLPQGVGVNISASVLQSDSTNSKHAVNIIGCRTLSNGTLEYLIHNSWGSGCKSYWPKYQTSDKCVGGRVWIPATNIINQTDTIQWISKK